MSQLAKWKTIGYSAAIFVAGAISGGALGIYETRSTLASAPREQEMALRFRNRLQARLGLTPDQVEKIKPIVDGAVSQLHAVRVDTVARTSRILDQSYTQISAILTPPQRLKLAQIQKERLAMQARWQEGRHHPGPGGGPHPPHPEPSGGTAP